MGAIVAGGLPGLLNQSSAQVIDGSLKFDSGSSNYLSRTPSSAGNRNTWTISTWIKRDTISFYQHPLLGGGSGTGHGFLIRFSPAAAGTDTLHIGDYTGSWQWQLVTSRVFRDTGWYHIVVSVDTTLSTSSDRVKLYINGTRETSFGTASYPSSSYNTFWNTNAFQVLGGQTWNGAINGYYNGRLSNTYFIDGLALGPGYFGSTDPLTNTWRPKKFRAEGTTVNDGTVWSSYLTTSSGSINNIANAFDGNTTTYSNSSANNVVFTFTPPTPIRYKNSVRIWLRTADHKARINGGTYIFNIGAPLAGQWMTLATGSGLINTIDVQYTANSLTAINAIEVDGVIMIDSTTTNLAFGTNGFYLPLDGNSPIGEDKSGKGNNWTPVNFGGSVALDNPQVSGARPILNTGTGGTVARPGVFGSEVGFRDTVSSSSGGGNPYIFNTNGTQPTFNFIRGATYVFDYSGATSHPLRFATAADAAGSTQYTDGTSVSGNVISFTVPHNAPNTLHYYCTNHSGMGNSISVTTDETKADPYAWKNTLALPLVGSANDVSNSVNSGSTAKTISVSGDPASSTTQSNFYGASFYFDGSASSDYVSAADNTELDVGSGDFTIECWAYVSGYPNTNPGLLSKRGGNGAAHWQLVLNRNGQIQFGDQATWSNYFGTSSGTTGDQIFKDNWHHIVITRTSGSVQAWYDGRKYGTAITNTTDFSTSANFSVGVGRENNYDPFQGYIQDVRVYKGVAKYTSDFVVASTSPDILPDTPSGVSGSSKLAKVTDGAVYFDGTGDYCSTGSSSDFTMGTGDFTVECFITKDDSSHRGIWQISSTSGGLQSSSYTQTLALGYQVNRWQLYAGGSQVDGASPPTNGLVSPRKWYHLAVVRNNGTTKLYVDGREEISTADTYNYTGTYMAFGGYYNTSYLHYGNISNLRVLKGTALYTSNFTPPTRELTNVTNTKLLCCQSNKKAYVASVVPGTTLNDGTVWSSNGGGNLADVSSWTNAFNGRVPTNNSSYSDVVACEGGQTSTVTFSPAISGNIRVFISSSASSGTINGSISLSDSSSVSADVYPNAAVFKDFGSKSNITSLTLNAGSNGGVRLSAIEVNGFLLIDGYSGKSVTVNGDAAASNFNPFNTDINTVRGQETGYCTLNPLNNNGGTLSNGNLKVAHSGAANVSSTFEIPTSGKWFWEYFLDRQVGGGVLGISDGSAMRGTGLGNWTKIYGYSPNGNKYEGTGSAAYGATLATGDLVGVKYDADTRQLEFFKNNVSQGLAFTVSNDYKYYPSIHVNNSDITANFGQKPFKFPPPDGFQPLNAANVRPETVITRPDQYVGVKLYTGDDATTHPITGLNFGTIPDFVWIKNRDQSEKHILHDTVRGIGSTLYSSSSDQADTGATYSARFKSFDFNGFTVGTTHTGTNSDGDDFVAWCWKAGGNKNTFNVGDVGYASASDVGMNVGGQNSAVYDQSAVWSNSFTSSNGFWSGQGATKAFDGQGNVSGTNSNGVLTFSPNLTIPANSTIEVKCSTQANGYTVTVNGVANDFDDSNVFTVVNYDGSTTLSTITVANKGSASGDLRGIKINGRLLVDNGVSVTNVPSIANTGASVGTKQGFSIVKYTGTYSSQPTTLATVSHGLLQSPNFIITKSTNNTNDSGYWNVYHSSLNANQYLRLGSTAAAATISSGAGGNIAAHPTNTTFNTYYYSGSGNSGSDYIGYVWHDVPGLQKFGSYTGGGSSYPFIELGFSPAILMIKDTSTGGTHYDWKIIDNTRNPFNLGGDNVDSKNVLFPNLNAAENKGGANWVQCDFLSNGFRMNDQSVSVNNSGSTYIYAAWAEAPSFNLYGAQSNAR